MISVLSGVDPNFPMHLWDRLLTGIEMQLNFLRQSNTVPTIPSFAHFWGPYDYNAHPMVPLYCVVEMHAKLSKRKTFGRHSVSGLNVGVSVEHYRCHKIWVKDTKSVWIGNTVSFKHKYLTMPTATATDALLTAAENLIKALDGDIPQSDASKETTDRSMELFTKNTLKYQEENAKQ